MKIDQDQIQQFRSQGYLVVSGLFSAADAQAMIDHYMAMRAEGEKPGDMGGRDDDPADPLNQYPRMINMHRWDEQTETWARDQGMWHVAGQLLDDAPVLRQTMLYFKPAGARGQGLHQDEQYITTNPLLGAWVALDRTDHANGQMVVAPQSHELGLLPVVPADMNESFTGGQTQMPDDAKVVGVDMEPGDVLFFDGKCIHGSYNNQTSDRFRRSFICHYVGEHSENYEPEEQHTMRGLNARDAKASS